MAPEPTSDADAGDNLPQELCFDSSDKVKAEPPRSGSSMSLERRLVSLALALPGFVALALRAPARAYKTASTAQYSAVESAGLPGQSNKDVKLYGDLGDGLKAAEIKVPTPEDPDFAQQVKDGDLVTVDLVGRLTGWNGLVFVKTTDAGGASENAVTFRVGAKEAIPGLDRGVLGMRKGGIRRLVIPGSLGYPRPILESDLGKPGAIPDPGISGPSVGSAWELRNRLVNGVLNNSQRDDTLVLDVKVKKIG